MSYRFLPALMIIVGLVTLAGAVPAAARVRPPPQVVSERNAATPVVVERIEIGRLGVAAPPVVRERRLHDIVGVASRRFTLMPKAFSIQSHVESCYYAKPSWRRYNGFGKLASKAWYYIEWCGKDNKVTRVLTLYCGGVASQGFSYDGCKVRRGSTGYSRLAVSGSWKFPFRVGAYTFLTLTEASELSTSILARWLLLTLTIALGPTLTVVGLVALWALVLQQLGKQGIALASMMSVVGVVSTVAVYGAV